MSGLRIISLTIFIATCILSCYSGERIYNEKLTQGYAGVIIEKYDDKRGWGCMLSDSAENRLQSAIGDKDIFEIAAIGDTIKKFSNSNKCILIKGEKIYRYNCYYIPPEIRAQLGKIEEW